MARGGATRFKPGLVPWNKVTPIEKVCACGVVFFVRPSWDRVKSCSRRCARLGKTSPMKGRIVSAETRERQRQAKLGIRGADHPNWRGGGCQTERHRLMQQDEYRQWRRAVFERDDYTCVECGQRGGALQADHISPWATHPALRYLVANGRTLCVTCHRATPTWGGRLLAYSPKGTPIYSIAGGADNVAITAGSGTTIATDERSISGTNVQVQRVYDIGASSGSAGQTTVTNTSTTIKAADETRKRIVLVNNQLVPVYIDPSGGTATTAMFRLDPGASVTLYVTCAVTGITSAAYTASGDDKVHYIVETSA